MWREHWDRVKLLTQNQLPYEYDLPIEPQAKERARGGRTPIKTRSWEALVSEAVISQAPSPPLTSRIGLEVLFLINSKNPPRHDLSNALKTLEDALNRRAYVDDKQIDYLSALRVWSPDTPSRIEARIYEI